MKCTRSLPEQILFPAFLSFVAVVSVFSRLFAGDASLAFFDDDFFYYLKIARMLASGCGSTFDGVHRTNGYHPLWLLTLTGLFKLFSHPGVIAAVLCLICISSVLTYYLAFSCFQRVSQSSYASAFSALLVAFGTLFLGQGGMEIILAIPLALAFLYFRTRPTFQWNLINSFFYGFIASLVVLSRIDALLWILPVLTLEIVSGKHCNLISRLETALMMLAGLTPLVVYLRLNNVWFGSVMPISSQAKQLRLHHTFSAVPFRALLTNITVYAQSLIVLPCVCSAVLAVVCLYKKDAVRLPEEHRLIVGTLMSFPLVHLTALSWLSDWPVWPWYLYSFILGETGALLILMSRNIRSSSVKLRAIRWTSSAVLLSSMTFYAAGRLYGAFHRRQSVYTIYDAAVKIASFSRSHPGLYAMGDRAGLAGYLMEEPLLQVEGLVMDKQYIDNVRQERPLINVLRTYGANYFVTTFPVIALNCYLVKEPLQAGPDSHVMRATICEKPIYSFTSHGVETDIFDLSKAQK